jgi:hypothetical protein
MILALRRAVSVRLAIGGVALMAIGALATWHFVREHDPVRVAVDFNRDIRPIFNEKCVACHGGVRQLSDVSFIYREETLGKGKSGRPTVVPGRPRASELMARVTSHDPETRMPYRAPPLEPREIDLLRRWIEEGAHWEDHWSFVAPTRQVQPEVKRTEWPRQPMDRFVLARLEQEGLGPSPEATKEELLRRVSLDLTGLPPTPEALTAFQADHSPDAYEKQVDRLLASNQYGERWASMWLDLARYADSKGYEKDTDRPVWPYRDWVIEAFNRNMLYDRFVITQLAGDLLPNASLGDRIATAFQRLTPVNDEGGTDDEEFRLVAVMDRAATTWSVLNGLTINCVQCHAHPYDPIRHEEYYKFLAFYNTSRDADREDDFPTLHVANKLSQRAEVAPMLTLQSRWMSEIVGSGRVLEESSKWTALPISNAVINEVSMLEKSVADLQKSSRDPGILLKKDRQQILAWFRNEIALKRAELAAKRKVPPRSLAIEKGEVRAFGTISSQSMYDLETQLTGASALTALRIEVPPLDARTARHTPEEGFMVNGVDAWLLTTVPEGTQERRIAFRFFARDSEEVLESAVKASAADEGQFSAVPKLTRPRWIVAIPETPITLAPDARLRVRLTQTGNISGRPAPLRRVRLAASTDERWTQLANDPASIEKLAELSRIESKLKKIPGVALPVMEEEAPHEQRPTLLFERGNLLAKVGQPLAPDVPALFPKLPADAPRDRLAMAKWFFSPDQPLTARVAVNRFWEQLFGTGIVETLEDFGSVGQPPSHRELLDSLAVHFQSDLHWDMKALLRELVTSATYRQSARVSPELMAKDPHNRLLARGPQQRLTAEMVRDQALAASGLLSTAIGGPPVMPPQPAGIWKTVYNDANWVDAKGADRYRRAIYTYLKRGAIYPSFVTFDASEHVVSLARRIPTNTPLQALNTLNDPVYKEAAEALARQILKSKSAGEYSDGQEMLRVRLNEGARRVLSRELSPGELRELETAYVDARKMVADSKRSAAEQRSAAFSVVASILLNLDAALTR